MMKGKMVAVVTGFLARIGRAVLGLVTKERLDRGKRCLEGWWQRYPDYRFGFVTTVAVVLFWLASPIYMSWMFAEHAGTKGDSFGALTSLFTGLAFVGLIVTLQQQKKQIKMQREDLKMQRIEMRRASDELSGQKKQMALQNQSLKQQMFEQTFFNLLNVFEEYRSDVELFDPNKPVRFGNLSNGPSGPAKFRATLADMLYVQGSMTERSDAPHLSAEDLQAERIALRFERNIEKKRGARDGYMRHVWNLISLIHLSKIENVEPYFDVLRAQLSEAELILIAVHCEQPAYEAFKSLAEQYELFRYMPNEYCGALIERIRQEIFQSSREEDDGEK